MNAEKNKTLTAVESPLTKDISVETDRNSPNEDQPYPYCVIPPYFFERALAKKKDEKGPLFTVETWDGRNVFSLKRNSAH